MSNHFARHAFIQWLSINSHRFHRPPCNIKKHKTHIIFNLKGITKLLQWEISEQGAFFTVYHKIPFTTERDTFWDGLIDFDVYAEQTESDEYYCSMCDKQYVRYYPTKLALWESHCFEEILDWTNKNVTTDKLLVLDQSKGYTSAALRSPSEWKQYKKRRDEEPFKITPIYTDS